MLAYFRSEVAEALAGRKTVQLRSARATTSLKRITCCVFLFASAAFAQNDVYQDKGMLDVDASASATIPHSSPSDTTGVFVGEVGYFVNLGSLIALTVDATFRRGAQDVFLGGGYRYFFGSERSRVRPFVGAGAGGNIAHFSGDTNSNFLAQGKVGLRYFLAQHVALEVGYQFDYVHIAGASFAQSTQSVITVGFAHVF